MLHPVSCIVLFTADDAASDSEAKSLFVAYSAIDEKSIDLLHQVAAVKANISTFHQADDGAVATLSVYCCSVVVLKLAITGTASLLFIDHPRSIVVYNFGHVCLSVCMSETTFESLDVGSSYLYIWCISMEYASGSYMQVKVKFTGAKRSKLCIHAI